MNIVEVMVVALLVVAVIVAWPAIESVVYTLGGPSEDLVGDEGHVCSFLPAYTLLPSENETLRFGSKFEEWGVQAVNKENNDLYDQIQAEWQLSGTRVTYQHNNDPLVILGPGKMPLGPNHACTLGQEAKWATTLIRPGLSHYAPNQAIDLQLLPMLTGGTLVQHGMPYEVTARLSDTDGNSYHQYTYGHVRPQTRAQLSPVNVTFQNNNGETIHSTSTDTLIPRQDALGLVKVWQIHINLTSDQAQPGEVWWTKHNLRVEPPPGWDYDAIEPVTEWATLPNIAQPDVDAPLRFQYRGPAAAGASTGVDLTINLTRPATSDVGTSQVATVWTEGARTSNNHIVLSPAVALRDEPFGLYASRSEPWTTSEWSPFRVHTVNPRNDTYQLEEVVVTFPEHAYQLVHADTTESRAAGWTMTRPTPDAMVFTWDHGESLSSGESHVLEFPVKIHKPEGFEDHNFEAPIVTAMDASGEVLHSVVGQPMNRPGQYGVTLPPMLGLGEHAVRVREGGPGGSPPGNAVYNVSLDGIGLLEDVQTARYTMELEAWPRVHAPGESVELGLETGSLLSTLRGLEAVDPGSVRVNVTTTDLWGWFTNDYQEQAEFPLPLDLGSQILGLEWVDVNGLGALDLVVTYRDGHVTVLNGDNLPAGRLWRVEMGGRVSAPPVLVEVDAVPGPELVVPVSQNGAKWLSVRDITTGDELERVDLQGFASHLVAAECVAGLWFMESDTDRVNAESVAMGSGFMDETPTTTRLAHWAPGMAEPVYGELRHEANPFAVLEGSFGPFGGCGVVSAVGFDVDSDPRLVLSRIDALDLEYERWRFEAPGLVRGAWVRDVATTPIETLSPWNAEPGRVDELVLVTDEFGLEVLSGWVGYERAQVDRFEDLLPGDRLLGLSWVNHDTGYVASEAGWLWRTTNAGASWDPVQAEPVVDAPRTLDGFVFGGNGEGLFVQDDGKFASFSNNAMGWFEWPDWQDMTYKDLAFTSNRPGIIGYSPALGVTAVFEWDRQSGEPVGAAINPIPCDCTATVGSDVALTGKAGGSVYVGTPLVDRVLDLDVDVVSAQRDGAILAHDGVEFIFNSTSGEHRLRDIDAHDVLGGSVVAAGAYPGGAVLTHGPYQYVLAGDSIQKQHLTSDALVGVSNGNGARWLVTETGLVRPEAPSSYWYAVQPGPDVSTNDTVTIKNPSTPDSNPLEWHAPSGLVYLLPGGQELPVAWENQSFVKFAPRSPENPSPVGAGPVLVVEGDFGSRTLETSREPACAACLVPAGFEDSVRFAEGEWSDGDGALPRVLLPTIGPSPVVVDRVGAGPLLATGTLGDGIYSFAADTGFTVNEIDTAELAGLFGAADTVVLGVADRPGLNDVLWAEAGTNPAAPGGAGGLLLGGALRSDVSPKLARLDPGTGDLTCVAQWPETDRIGGRLMVASPDDPEALFSGTGLGRLGATVSGACTNDFEEETSDTGTRLVLSVPSPERDWLGTRIYLVDIIVDVEGLGDVRVQLMDHSLTNSSDYPRATVNYKAVLYVWDWVNMWPSK